MTSSTSLPERPIITPPTISADALLKKFGQTIAVKELSLEVYPGEIFGLVGPDGAGKSTSLRMLATIMDPDAGSASIAGFDTVKESVSVKDHLAYMSQKFGLYQDLSVGENINFYADLYGMSRKGRKNRIDELLDFSNMRPFIKRRAGNLSGGMKQKLQLVCALIHTPKVLLLDEPTNGVDPVSRRDFWRILHRLRQDEVTILITTAYLDEAERCDRVGLIDEGKILAIDTPEEIKKLLKGKMLAIRSNSARQIVKLLHHQPFTRSATIFGDRVHLVGEENILTSTTIAKEWETGTMEQLISTPLRGPELIFGKIAPYFLIGMIDMSLAVLMGKWIFNVAIVGNSGLLFGMSSIFLVGALFFGITLSIKLKSQVLANQIAIIAGFLPTLLLSGFVFAIENMPLPLQFLTYIVPARYFSAILRAIYLKGIGLEILWLNVLFLLIYGLIMIIVANRNFSFKLE